MPEKPPQRAAGNRPMGEVSIMLPQYQYKYLVTQACVGGVTPSQVNLLNFSYPLQSILRHLESSYQFVGEIKLAKMMAR